jgi:hypothetical protein
MAVKKRYMFAGPLILALLVLGTNPGNAQFDETPEQPGTTTGTCPSNCNYCCEDYCGCSVPEGYFFTGYCACSSIQCTQVCTYSPPRTS